MTKRESPWKETFQGLGSVASAAVVFGLVYVIAVMLGIL